MTGFDTGEKNVEPVDIEAKSVEQEVSIAVVDGKDDNTGDRKLLRKLDWFLVPPMTLFYLLSSLDRSNIGQAKLDGLTTSLKLTSPQYNACLSIVYATYLTCQIPSTLILKRLRPSRWLPLIMLAWGVITTLTGLVNSYGGLLACRLLLGVAEAGLYPGANYYFSSWYKRRELSWRVSILSSAVALGGAFGGILAYGINKMDGLGGQEGWRWIFHIEGIVTVVVAVFSYFLISDFPSNRPKFLTESECNRVIARLQTDAGPGADQHFSCKQICSVFSDWKIYIWALCNISICIPTYSLAVYSPTIIKDLGFASYRAQLLTAPPYALAFITTMTTAYFSDKYARRSIFIIFWLTICIVGFIILITVQHLSVQYFAIFLTISGLSPCVASCITFLSCNISPHVRRATALGFVIAVGNSGGLIGGQVYRTQDAPRYILGHAINLGCCVIGIIAATILLVTLHLENRRRDRLYGPITIMESTQMPISVTEKQTIDVSRMGSVEDKQLWGYQNMSEKEIRDLGDQHATWRYIL